MGSRLLYSCCCITTYVGGPYYSSIYNQQIDREQTLMEIQYHEKERVIRSKM